MPENTEVQEAQTEETTEVVEKNDHPGLEGLDDATKTEIIKLRRESAERRVKAKEIQTELESLKAEREAEKQRKMEEDGKLKELLDIKSKELEELQGVKKEKELYDSIFKEQLETAIGKLSTTQAELIAESGLSIGDKLKWANRLAQESTTKKDSPDSTRPGGDGEIIKDINLDDYAGKEGRLRLAQLQTTNPKMFDLVVKMKQNL
jgi:hypothetical protein